MKKYLSENMVKKGCQSSSIKANTVYQHYWVKGINSITIKNEGLKNLTIKFWNIL